MPRRQSCPTPLPRHWLMTDERLGDSLCSAILALPRGSGVVFRHYATPKAQRARIFKHVARLASRRDLLLVVAGELPIPGNFPRHGRHKGVLTAPAHNVPEAVAAIRSDARLLFLSPVFPTRSHPGTRTLGVVRLGLLAQSIRAKPNPPALIALGGMNRTRARQLQPLKLRGWAAIDAWLD